MSSISYTHLFFFSQFGKEDLIMTNTNNFKMTAETVNVDALKQCIHDGDANGICNLRIPGIAVFTSDTPYVVVTTVLDSNVSEEYLVALHDEIAKTIKEWRLNGCEEAKMRYPTYYSYNTQREEGLCGVGIWRIKVSLMREKFGYSNGRIGFTMKGVRYEFDAKLLGSKFKEFEEFLKQEGYTEGLDILTDRDWTYIPANDVVRNGYREYMSTEVNRRRI